MCQIIKHLPNHNCSAENIFLSGFGLACGKCGQQCQCENKREFEIEKKQIEEEHEKFKHQYSYPHFQIEELKKKYNQS